jgi:hypothetical protein
MLDLNVIVVAEDEEWRMQRISEVWKNIEQLLYSFELLS